MSDSAGQEFWDFSLGFYRRPGVSDACILLQDNHRKDVNLILYACWIGLSGRGRLSAAELAAAKEAVGPWRRSVIEPLRAARRATKQMMAADDDVAFYGSVKAVELAAERRAQYRLAALAPPKTSVADGPADATWNLGLYLGDEEPRPAAAPIFAALTAIVSRE